MIDDEATPACAKPKKLMLMLEFSLAPALITCANILNEVCEQNGRCELQPMWLTHRVISDRVHRLLVTLSYFRPDRFVQLLSLIPILNLLLYFLVSGCLTSLC